MTRLPSPHLLLPLEDDDEELLDDELLPLLLLLPLASSPWAASRSATAASAGRLVRRAVSSLADIFGRPFLVWRQT